MLTGIRSHGILFFMSEQTGRDFSPIQMTDRQLARALIRPSRKSVHTWALYLGNKLIAEGRADSYPAVTKPIMVAAYEHAKTQGWDSEVMGIDAIATYRVSVWGPRGGNVEHMKPIRSK